MSGDFSVLKVQALELLDSRGVPTVGCRLQLANGQSGVGLVPSGSSTGAHECLELRDGDHGRYHGKGVLNAVAHIEKVIAPALVQSGADSLSEVDGFLCALDGTEKKSRLGGNALLAVSLAYANARSSGLDGGCFELLRQSSEKQILPVPFMNMINGGAHAENALMIQEFMLVPFGFKHFREALRCGAEVMKVLGELLGRKYGSLGQGFEGGYAPFACHSSAQALDMLLEAVRVAGYGSDQVGVALDIAATEFYDAKKGYATCTSRASYLSSRDWADHVLDLAKSYNILSLEDPMAEDDWEGWQYLSQKASQGLQLVGDDVFVTNARRLQMGAERKVANAILIKPNQVGTLSEVMQTVALAKTLGFGQIFSHRSGETEDTMVSDLATALGAGQIKIGPPRQSDRTCKLNRLLWLEKLYGLELSQEPDFRFRNTCVEAV